MRKLSILILHSLGNPDKSPNFLRHHVFALRKYYPENNYIYHDTTVDSADEIKHLAVDAILLDVSFLWARWAEGDQFDVTKKKYAFVGESQAIKLAFPQDEYDCNELLDDWMCDWNIDIVYSVISENWNVLYPKYSKIGSLRLAYTGYIDESQLSFMPSPWSSRPIDIGYRARKLPPYFGRIGETKSLIGQYVKQHCNKTEWVADIIVGDAGSLHGNMWLDFINDCKFTLGANSGSSLLDPKGLIQRNVRAYISANPNARFEEVERACFAGLDGHYEFTAISPRVLEAALLDSCQILVEGQYSGILQPWEHYIPIKADASDFDKVSEAMKDSALVSRLISNCKSTLLDNKALRYRSHALSIIQTINELIESSPSRAASKKINEIPFALHNEKENFAEKKGVSFNDDMKKDNVLLLVSHQPHCDPRLDWIVKGVKKDIVIHQLGISRIKNDKPCESGSSESGWIWSYPRVEDSYELGVIKNLLLSRNNSYATLELAGIIATLSKSDAALALSIGPDSTPRIKLFRWYLEYILKITFSLLKHAEKISDISAVIATDLDTLIAGIILKERWCVPLVYDAHEFWPEADVDQLPFERDFWIALEGRLVKHVDYAQTVSPSLASYMTNSYGIHFTAIPNAEPLASIVNPGIKKTHAKNCRFLFQGGFAPARGIDVLIRAWAETSESATLYLRGPDNPYKYEMIQLSKALGLFGKRVFFPEAVAESELISAAADYDVGVIPYLPIGVNYSNCCPNKLSQYLAAGLPILASKTNYIDEIIFESGAGLSINFSDKNLLINTVNHLVEDVSQREIYSQRAKLYFTESFNWGKVSRVFYARLYGLINKSNRLPYVEYENTDREPFFSQISTPDRQVVLMPYFFSSARIIWRILPASIRYSAWSILRRLAGRGR